jgi:arabinofuranosyltransferase
MLRWGLLIAVVGLCIGHALVFNFVNDDAFISFRYADNLVRHGELVFNLGERVEGYTNFLWTLVMAGVMALGLDPVTWSKALGIVLAVGALLIVARFTARMEGRKGPGDALAPLLLAAAPGYACWATGGLETALFTFLVTGGWAAFLEEREPPAPGKKRLPVSALWFAFAAMTRPEGVLLFGLCGLYRIGEMLSERRFKPTRQDWVWGGLFLLAFGPYYAWRFAYYGYPFPNTWYVKSGAKSFWGPGLNYVWDWISTHFLWAVPVLAVIKRGWPGSRQGRMLALTALFTVVMCVHVARVGGDFMALHRFLVPLLPMLAVVAATGLRALWATLRERGHSALRLGVGSTVLAALLTVHVVRVDQDALKIDSQGGVDSIGWLAWFADQCTTIGQWLAENTNENDVLATTAAGIIPFYARRPTLDLLGLNDAWIAHNVPATGNRPGHTKHAPPGYAEEKGVTIFIGHPEPSAQKPRGGGRPGYTFEAVQIPGLRIEGRKARTPAEAQSDAWWGYWRRTGQKPPRQP